MRISQNYYGTLYNTSMIRQSQDITTSESGKNNYDEITIRSAPKEEMDSKFISSLKNALMKEVKQTTSEEKLNLLRQKIEDGTYQVDANKIAERILLYKGADFHE
ncbi:flagellar biosynthesis anti-sigma factor FlgM [Lacrimispora sphenoides]|uniref:Negative regulator of flagellin synthesis FlgM n=1 Tax=Lacrimispora sphenoides JCM 1415 TaxID=1297793 RepID=A0ABY1CCT1_9FIRM|nr:flagellar biosynthesis anti-sigma factor FlgM [Lacrimispora sphenoides]SET93379.1 negative regulator of flagellin synthesis FlgM [[Clostridium] sphenoides JCM 1415]SUY52486.1 anti-sigma-28 factor FlgM [Lacrimispora sphenoides]